MTMFDAITPEGIMPTPVGRRAVARAVRHHTSRSLLEQLEERTLLNGLTVIAHGAELFGGAGSSSRPGWIDSMGQAVAARYGGNTAIYALRVEPNGDNAVKIASFTRLSGAANSAAGTSGETVLLLDWAAVSNVGILPPKSDYSTTLISNAVLPYLTTAFPNVGINSPLAEGTIQLIGHSRGGSMIAELARGLGNVGIWVDHLTFLDPRPVPSDPLNISVRSNVIFADNYYQTSGDGLFVPNGVTVSGAVNTGPLKVEGSGLGHTHNNIILFYQGTVDTSSTANIQSVKVPNSWYADNNVNRETTGFYYAHGGGGAWARPASGLSSAFGGSVSRSAAARTSGAAQWANVSSINVSATTLAPMQSFTASFRYSSFNTNASMQWYLDPDTNPYNNNSLALGNASTLGATGENVVFTNANLSAVAPAGTYFLEARISNAAGTRYAYSVPIVVAGNTAPTGSIDIAGPAALQGWAVDTDDKNASVTVRLDVDGITFKTMTANLSRPDLVATFGSANHGFSFDLTGLSKGTHKIELFAQDTGSGAASLVASRTINTNQTPIGSIDWFDGSILAGWTVDPDATSSAIKIRYAVDNNAPVILTANATRGDLTQYFGSADHGFALVLPQLTAGNHTITVHAIDPVSQALTLLGTRTATVANLPGNPLPLGSIDLVNTTVVAGWAYDPSNPTQAINIRIDVDGVAGSVSMANLTRTDLQTVIGSTNHGYHRALSLTPGQHRIDVYMLDTAANSLVLLGSRIVGATVPVGSIDVASSTQIAGWAYSSAVALGGATSAIIRIDINSLPGAAFTTDLSRPDITQLYSAGTWGYSITAPPLTAGTHSVSLVYIDAFSLTNTVLVTRTITI
jgi:hypothetical protein